MHFQTWPHFSAVFLPARGQLIFQRLIFVVHVNSMFNSMCNHLFSMESILLIWQDPNTALPRRLTPLGNHLAQLPVDAGSAKLLAPWFHLVGVLCNSDSDVILIFQVQDYVQDCIILHPQEKQSGQCDTSEGFISRAVSLCNTSSPMPHEFYLP